MRRAGPRLSLLLALVIAGGCEYEHQLTSSPDLPSLRWPGWPSRLVDFSLPESGLPRDGGAPELPLLGDGGAPLDAPATPTCSSFVTQQGEVCVTCSAPLGKPVYSCTASAPSPGATCHSVDMGTQVCKVCHDERATLLSKICAPKNGCTVLSEGGHICLACSSAGREVSRKCVSAIVNCKSVSTPHEVCVECINASGQVVEKQCLPTTETCSSQTIEGKLCLVCKDGGGEVVKKICDGTRDFS